MAIFNSITEVYNTRITTILKYASFLWVTSECNLLCGNIKNINACTFNVLYVFFSFTQIFQFSQGIIDAIWQVKILKEGNQTEMSINTTTNDGRLTRALWPAISWSSSVCTLVLLRTSKSSVSKSESSNSSGVCNETTERESGAKEGQRRRDRWKQPNEQGGEKKQGKG